MRRWLVTLALAVVALPTVGDAQGFRVELANRTVTTTTKRLAAPACLARIAKLPASVEVDAGAIMITTRKHTFRHSLGRRDGLSWLVGMGPHVVVGFAAKSGAAPGTADTIVAFDHTTGRVAWRRSMDSMFAAELVDSLLAVERAGNLDIIDARTGKTLGTTPIAGRSIQAVCRPSSGDLHIKTNADLIAIDRATGAVQWTQPTSSVGNPTVTSTAVIDAWVDRKNHRFGIVSYDPRTGKQLDKIDLGATGGWYDFEHVYIAPDGVNDVLVSATFAVE
jgi:outer membrane protein assembly factor BamB